MHKDAINYQSLFDQMPVIRFLLRLKEGVFYLSSANKRAISFFDKPLDEIIAQPLSKMMPDKAYDKMVVSLNVSFEKRLPVTIPMQDKSFGGKILPNFWVTPIVEGGEVVYLDVIEQPGEADVSIVERERDDALSLLTSIFDASEVGILVSDRKRHIIKMNDSFERIYGWSREDTIGKDFLEFVTDDEKRIAEKSYEEFLKHDQNYSGEVKVFRKEGAVANTMFTTASLKLSHDRRFQVTTLVDITDRKQMESSLRFAKDRADSANNAKSVFLANMSHELRTPLNAIIGFSELMVNEVLGPLKNKKYLEYLSDVHLSAKHLLEIINEVLDMSKIEAGKIELEEEEIDLSALIKTLVRIMKSSALSHNVVIKEVHQENLPKLYADARLIRQVLINLITNSIKYSVEGGEIVIETRLNKKDEIEFFVSDKGVGIPQDRIKEAMEPFGQIHDPSTHDEIYQGTGLGLPLAKAMIEMHGGVFKLESEVGKGTTVSVSFSIARTQRH